MNTQKKIAIVAGGETSEWEVSLKSAEGIMSFLKETPYELYEVVIHKGEWYCLKNGQRYDIDKNDFSCSIQGEKVKFDFAYITIHGHPGEDGALQGYFDLIHLPYSTSSSLVSAVTYDKYVCKEFLKSRDILLAKSVVISGNEYNEEEILHEVGLPCFVKPNVGGSSFGVSKVKRSEELRDAILTAQKESDVILVEEFIDGKELSCGFCKIGKEIKVFPIAEIVSEKEFFDYEAKYNGLSKEIVPARLSAELTQRVQELTARVAEWLGMKNLGRVDYILRGDEIFFLEINTTPGMTSESIVPKQVKAYGWTMGECLMEIIENGGK